MEGRLAKQRLRDTAFPVDRNDWLLLVADDFSRSALWRTKRFLSFYVDQAFIRSLHKTISGCLVGLSASLVLCSASRRSARLETWLNPSRDRGLVGL